MIITYGEANYITIFVEWFLYGLYSGIFAIYLQCPKKESRSAKIIFYVLCLLYVLSTATVVSDLLYVIFQIYYGLWQRSKSPQLQIDMLSMESRIFFVQNTIAGCSDVIAQFILIYRCWIVWGKNIRVVIIPSILAITFIATWMIGEIPDRILAGTLALSTTSWGNILTLTALAATMVVNTLVTGLIVFKILKVLLEAKTTVTSVERTLGSLSSTAGNPKLQHIIFIIIESGMALFAIHLVRIVLTLLAPIAYPSAGVYLAYYLVIISHAMLNVGIAPTIIFVLSAMRLSFDDEESFKEGVGSLRFNNPPSDPNSQALGSRGSGEERGNLF